MFCPRRMTSVTIFHPAQGDPRREFYMAGNLVSYHINNASAPDHMNKKTCG